MPSASTRGDTHDTPGRYGPTDVCTADHVAPASVDDHTDTPLAVAATAHRAVVEPGCENTPVAVIAVGPIPVNVSDANDQRRYPFEPTRCNCPPITSTDDTDDRPDPCGADHDNPPFDDENTYPYCDTTTSFEPSETNIVGL